MPPILIPSIIPTGGAVALSVSGGALSGTATLVRTVSGAVSGLTLYNGTPLSYFLDAGDGTAAPLVPTTAYQWTYTDVTGAYTTPFIQPASYIALQTEPITALLIRLIQGAFNSVTLPVGVLPAQVTQAMPLGGQIAMPLIVVCLELEQQAEVPIGQSIQHQPSNVAISIGGAASGFTITGFVERTYRVSVLAENVQSRDFYKSLVISTFVSNYGPVFQYLGVDVTHRFQVSAGQVAKNKDDMQPGFYYADCILTLKGTLDFIYYPGQFGPINTIIATVSGSSGGPYAVDVVQVPIT